MERFRLTWVATTGGPHLIVPERYAPAWEGCFAPSAGRTVQAVFRCDPRGPATDYDRACDVSGWLGVIPVGRGQALVLGGDDSQAAYYRWVRGHYILRWLYAESETELLDHFHDVEGALPVEEEAEFRHPGGRLLLMDSADVPRQVPHQHTTFTLPRGRYRVQTGHSKTPSTFLIVHRLRPEQRRAEVSAAADPARVFGFGTRSSRRGPRR